MNLEDEGPEHSSKSTCKRMPYIEEATHCDFIDN